MFSYIVRRLVSLVGVMALVAVLAFLLIHITPGDPAQVMLGEEATAEAIERVRAQLGLDAPLHIQFVQWFDKLFRGELMSIYTRQPVVEAIMSRLPVTASVSLGALLVAVAIGFPLGLLSAVYRGTWIDGLGMVIASTGVAIPPFWLGMNMIFLLAVTWQWLPSGGYVPFGESPVGWVKSIAMPSFSLGFVQAALLARMTRSCVVDVLNEDYVRTARSKGIRERLVVLRHALPNALNTILTVIGLIVGLLMSGAVVTEQVFTLPGIGRLLIGAVTNRDYTIVQAVIIFAAFTYALINLVVDLLYAFVDPRITYS